MSTRSRGCIKGIITLAISAAVVAGVGVASNMYTNSYREPPPASAAAVEYLATPPTQRSDRKNLAVIGDSYSAEGGFGVTGRLWPSQVARQHDLFLSNAAVGATGYGSPKNSFRAQAELVVPREPDIIIVAGSRNDERWKAAASEAIVPTLTYLRESLPDTDIIVVGPLWDNDPVTQWAAKNNEEIRTAAEALGMPFVDAIGAQWLSDPALIGEDDLHPNAAGHKVLARHLGDAVSKAGFGSGK